MIVHVHVYYIVLIFCGVKDLTPETFLYCFVTYLLHFMNQMHSLIYIFFVYIDLIYQLWNFNIKHKAVILFYFIHITSIILYYYYVMYSYVYMYQLTWFDSTGLKKMLFFYTNNKDIFKCLVWSNTCILLDCTCTFCIFLTCLDSYWYTLFLYTLCKNSAFKSFYAYTF